ncbi:7-carboxy-7-deazaguanine synthase QueE [Chondrinema litorale]|uniref:7-carboxy-7-deazaguanine synthase QueE n=1 Tax=Chondrinema litorale TaxID=2994555 RepID=UPI0025430042|nr:7-carboxy-7-deazaguanine synthase QueE [Chondrinema litorale]UZR94170.1 7-carboxy-7-deazaguanine synthase QueE [Chondrinema litorale]
MKQFQEQQVLEKQSTLPVMEVFYTIQGEGAYSGHAAYFIRLGGCDVGCFWCDVKESWDEEKHPQMAVNDIVEEAKKHPARLAVITGGEPLMHDLSELTSQLKSAGFRTHIETSGAHPLSGQLDWITLSPKKFKKALPEIIPQANELKVVIYNKSDFKWAEQYADQVNDSCLLLLQPEWDKEKEMLPQIIEYVKEKPHWKVSLQTHKYMNIP